jgi:hypothetical protein
VAGDAKRQRRGRPARLRSPISRPIGLAERREDGELLLEEDVVVVQPMDDIAT